MLTARHAVHRSVYRLLQWNIEHCKVNLLLSCIRSDAGNFPTMASRTCTSSLSPTISGATWAFASSITRQCDHSMQYKDMMVHIISIFFPVNKKKLSLRRAKWFALDFMVVSKIISDSYFWWVASSFTSILLSSTILFRMTFLLFAILCTEHLNLYVKCSPSPALNSYHHYLCKR